MSVVLQNVGKKEHYMRITSSGELDGTGGGGKWCNFKVHNHGDGIVSLQSVEMAKEKADSFHIGGQEDGSIKDPADTGRGKAGQWQVFRCAGEEGDPTKCTGENPLHKPGVYIFKSVKGGKNLRINEDGSVNATGGNGKWARFVVTLHGGGGGGGGGAGGRKVRLQSRKFGGHLRIKEDGGVDGEGGTGNKTVFIVHNHGDGVISLQSHFHHKSHPERMHIGGQEDGSMKDPSETGRGKAGQWKVVRVEGDPDGDKFHECGGADPLHKTGTYMFRSVKGGKYLRIQEGGKVNAEGGTGSQVRFTVTHC